MQQKTRKPWRLDVQQKGTVETRYSPPLQTPACGAEVGTGVDSIRDSSGAIQLEGCAAEWED
jgi:hypothetical protein